MSVRSASEANRLELTSSNIPSDTTFSLSVWVRLDDSNTNYQGACYWTQTTSDYSSLYPHDQASSGTKFYDKADAVVLNIAGNPTAGVWYWYGVRRNGNSATMYLHRSSGLGTVSTASATSSNKTNTPSYFQVLGEDRLNWNEYLKGDMAALKIWNAFLTEDELVAERGLYLPQRTTGLHLFAPFNEIDVATFRDYSGNGRNFTEVGTVTQSDGPPIAWKKGRRRLIIPASVASLSATAGLASVTAAGLEATSSGTGTATVTAGLASVTATALAPTGSGTGSTSTDSGIASVLVAALALVGAGSGYTSVTCGLAEASASGLEAAAVASGAAEVDADIASCIADALQASAGGTGTAEVSAGLASVDVSGLQASVGALEQEVDAGIASADVSGLQASASGYGSVAVSSGLPSVTAEGLISSATGYGSAAASGGIAEVTATGLGSTATGYGSATTSAGLSSVTAAGLEATSIGYGNAPATGGLAAVTATGLGATASGSGSVSVTSGLSSVTVAGLGATATGYGSATATAGLASITAAGLDAAGEVGGQGYAGLASVTVEGLGATAEGTGTAEVTAGLATVTAEALDVSESAELVGIYYDPIFWRHPGFVSFGAYYDPVLWRHIGQYSIVTAGLAEVSAQGLDAFPQSLGGDVGIPVHGLFWSRIGLGAIATQTATAGLAQITAEALVPNGGMQAGWFSALGDLIGINGATPGSRPTETAQVTAEALAATASGTGTAPNKWVDIATAASSALAPTATGTGTTTVTAGLATVQASALYADRTIPGETYSKLAEVTVTALAPTATGYGSIQVTAGLAQVVAYIPWSSADNSIEIYRRAALMDWLCMDAPAVGSMDKLHRAISLGSYEHAGSWDAPTGPPKIDPESIGLKTGGDL